MVESCTPSFWYWQPLNVAQGEVLSFASQQPYFFSVFFLLVPTSSTGIPGISCGGVLYMPEACEWYM